MSPLTPPSGTHPTPHPLTPPPRGGGALFPPPPVLLAARDTGRWARMGAGVAGSSPRHPMHLAAGALGDGAADGYLDLLARCSLAAPRAVASLPRSSPRRAARPPGAAAAFRQSCHRDKAAKPARLPVPPGRAGPVWAHCPVRRARRWAAGCPARAPGPGTPPRLNSAGRQLMNACAPPMCRLSRVQHGTAATAGVTAPWRLSLPLTAQRPQPSGPRP